MKAVLLSLLFLALAVVSAQARLGEELAQLANRYGDPLPKPDQKPPPNQIGSQEVFQKNGFQIDVTLLDGVSAQESFKKLNGDSFTNAEVDILLAANAQDHAWQAPRKAGGQTRWTRDDGAVAILTGRTLKITSTSLLNTEAQAKQLDRAPSLEGF